MGSLQIEMLASTHRMGLLAYKINADTYTLLYEISRNNPVLVLQNIGLSWIPVWHYAVVIGYDLERNIIVLHSGMRKNYEMKLSTFEKTWRRADNWGFLAVKPCEVTDTMVASDYFASAVAFERDNTESKINRIYESAVTKWPEDKLINLAFANYLYSNGLLDDAVKIYNSILDYQPYWPTVHNNLAQTYSDLGELNLAKLHAEIAIKHGGVFVYGYRKKLQDINHKLGAD